MTRPTSVEQAAIQMLRSILAKQVRGYEICPRLAKWALRETQPAKIRKAKQKAAA